MTTVECARMEQLEKIARKDIRYQVLMQDLRTVEKEYNLVLHDLDDRQRNAICDFVSQCEEISWYMLELACRHMLFQ